MADVARSTAFVTGATGFLGRELIRVLVRRGIRVFGLASSVDAAECVRRVGGVAVRGDLLVPGQWLDEAAADWVFHIPPCIPPTARSGSRTRAERVGASQVEMDTHLLDAVAAGTTRRILYVADPGCYVPTGPRPVTEDELPVSTDARRCCTPALDRLDGYGVAGLPVITAFPGCVYGNGAWFRERLVKPIMAGRRVLQFGNTGPWVSPIHVHDCARALVHLAEHGEIGSRYFLVNSEPIRTHEFARTFARLARRPLRVWRVPAAAARLIGHSSVAGRLQADAAFSNIRLRGTGFRFRYPTLEKGLEQIVGALDE